MWRAGQSCCCCSCRWWCLHYCWAKDWRTGIAVGVLPRCLMLLSQDRTTVAADPDNCWRQYEQLRRVPSGPYRNALEERWCRHPRAVAGLGLIIGAVLGLSLRLSRKLQTAVRRSFRRRKASLWGKHSNVVPPCDPCCDRCHDGRCSDKHERSLVIK